MASAVFGVRAVTIGMPRSTTSYIGPSLQHTFRLVWSRQAYSDQTGNALMASRWCHGRVAGSWCGMRPVLTPSHHRISRVLPVVLERSHQLRKSGRSESTLTLTGVIRSSQSPLRPLAIPAGVGPSPPAGVG